MKEVIKNAPLSLLVYISLLVMFAGTLFVPQIGTYFPEFQTIWMTMEEDGKMAGDYLVATFVTPTMSKEIIKIADASKEDSILYEESQRDVLTITDIGEDEQSVEETKPEEPKIDYDAAIVQGSFYIEAKVDKDYFNDAVFIGDSRTVGLCEYSGLDNADFLASVGLNIYNVLEKPIQLNGEEYTTVHDALTRKRYGKIYIMLGINEIGTGTAQSFFEKYAEVVEQIRKWQPGSVIIVQSIMGVGAQKSATSSHMNNKNIQKRNDLLKTLQNDWNIYYLDINKAVCDEEGNLISSYTFDQVHLYAKYYTLWSDYLMQHAYVKNSLD